MPAARWIKRDRFYLNANGVKPVKVYSGGDLLFGVRLDLIGSRSLYGGQCRLLPLFHTVADKEQNVRSVGGFGHGSVADLPRITEQPITDAFGYIVIGNVFIGSKNGITVPVIGKGFLQSVDVIPARLFNVFEQLFGICLVRNTALVRRNRKVIQIP